MVKPVREKVIIATKSRSLSKGIKVLLAPQEHLQVVSETKTAKELGNILELFPLGIVIFDLPNSDKWIPQLKRKKPLSQFLLLNTSSISNEADLVYRNEGSLITSIKKLASKPIPQKVSLEIKTENKFRQVLQQQELSEQQRNIIELISWGETNQEIAQKLHLSEPTIKSHISRICLQLGVKKRTQIIAIALRGGLVS